MESKMATVHNVYRERLQAGDVYIGRPNARAYVDGRPVLGYTGYFGNPHVLRHEGERSAVIAAFEQDARARIADDPVYRERVKQLHGKRLFCFCAPKACHGHVLAELAAELTAADAE